MGTVIPSEVRTALVHALLMLSSMFVAVWTGQPLALAAVGVAALGWWVWRHPEPHLGIANGITAIRVVLAASLAGLHPSGLVPWGGAIVLLIFALDGLDGWWARRTRTASAFGAAFDQEADAFMVAMASTCMVQVGIAPAWILVVGALRYAYVLVVWTLQTHGEAPRSAIARHAFGIWVVSAVAAMLRPTPPWRGALMLASALIVASFARSLWWSWRGPVGGGRQ